jgi:hypothetical protein
MVSTDHFRRELRAQFIRAHSQGRTDIIVNAGELHRMLGGYPGSNHGMQTCCDAMQGEIQHGDDLVVEIEGSRLTIRYQLPR